jgi:hypothetical protein
MVLVGVLCGRAHCDISRDRNVKSGIGSASSRVTDNYVRFLLTDNSWIRAGPVNSANTSLQRFPERECVDQSHVFRRWQNPS